MELSTFKSFFKCLGTPKEGQLHSALVFSFFASKEVLKFVSSCFIYLNSKSWNIFKVKLQGS